MLHPSKLPCDVKNIEISTTIQMADNSNVDNNNNNNKINLTRQK